MQLKKLNNPHPLGYLQMSLFILIELLLIFDKTFSKFHLIGPLYLYDILLIILTLVSGFLVLKSKLIVKEWSIVVLIGVAVLYVLYSFFILKTPTNYTVRQFAIIVYLFNIYLIFSAFISINAQEYNLRFLILLGIGSIVLQIGFHAYNLITVPGYLSRIFDSFNYYSEMGFMALFTFLAYILVYFGKKNKLLIIIFFLFVIISLGHQGSAIIVSFIIIASYLFLMSNFFFKKTLLLGTAFLVFLIFYSNSDFFLDQNTMWRIAFWKTSLSDIVFTKLGVLGHGFGITFTSSEVLEIMRNELKDIRFETTPSEQYLSPMHNSFITIAYHIGFVFMLLIFVPLKNMFLYILNRNNNTPTLAKDFLSITLIGLIGWSSFHVILELPHSSALFWLVYFSTIYEFNHKPKPIA